MGPRVLKELKEGGKIGGSGPPGAIGVLCANMAVNYLL